MMNKYIWILLVLLIVVISSLFLWSDRYVYFIDGGEGTPTAELWRINKWTGDIQASNPILYSGDKGLAHDYWEKGL